MTALNIYFSTNTPNFDRPKAIAAPNATGGASGSLNMGYSVGVTSTRAADFLELRAMLYSTGTTTTGITKQNILDFLDCAREWVLAGPIGFDATRTNGEGFSLDDVIQSAITDAGVATAATAAIP